VMESINVVIDDEEVERPSSREENQLISVEVTNGTTDNVKVSPSMSPMSLLPFPRLQIQLPVLLKMKILLQILPSGHG
jgi:hypothetical protein